MTPCGKPVRAKSEAQGSGEVVLKASMCADADLEEVHMGAYEFSARFSLSGEIDYNSWG